jgi:hypothetical protein
MAGLRNSPRSLSVRWLEVYHAAGSARTGSHRPWPHGSAAPPRAGELDARGRRRGTGHSEQRRDAPAATTNRSPSGPQALPSNYGQESRVHGYTPIVLGHLSACHLRRLDQPGLASVGGGSTPRSRRAARTSIHVRSPAPRAVPYRPAGAGAARGAQTPPRGGGPPGGVVLAGAGCDPGSGDDTDLPIRAAAFCAARLGSSVRSVRAIGATDR